MPFRTLFAGAALFVVAYGSTLTSSFHFDDYYMLQDPVVTDSSGWWEAFRPERTRPLTYLTFWLNYQLGAEDSAGYHAVNQLLHGLTAWFAWTLFQSLLRPRAALLAAAIFAFHPLQSRACRVCVCARHPFSNSLCRAVVEGVGWEALLDLHAVVRARSARKGGSHRAAVVSGGLRMLLSADSVCGTGGVG